MTRLCNRFGPMNASTPCSRSFQVWGAFDLAEMSIYVQFLILLSGGYFLSAHPSRSRPCQVHLHPHYKGTALIYTVTINQHPASSAAPPSPCPFGRTCVPRVPVKVPFPSVLRTVQASLLQLPTVAQHVSRLPAKDAGCLRPILRPPGVTQSRHAKMHHTSSSSTCPVL